MNRFLLFACYRYYPEGGWGDFVCAFEKLPSRERVLDMLKLKKADDADWWELVDTTTLSVVLSKGDS